MHIALSLPAEDASPWVDLFASALPEATIHLHEHTTVTPEMMAHMNAGGGPPASQPWLQNAMRADPDLKVFVAAGRYDSLNMCEGNLKMTGKLEPALSARFADHCYEGGHMMYRVQATRLQLAKDLEAFVKAAGK